MVYYIMIDLILKFTKNEKIILILIKMVNTYTKKTLVINRKKKVIYSKKKF
jgi:hypothetical protein